MENIEDINTSTLLWVVAEIGGYTITVNDGTGKPRFFHVESDVDLVNGFGPEVADKVIRGCIQGNTQGVIVGVEFHEETDENHQIMDRNRAG